MLAESADFQTILDAEGTYTVAVSAPADRPRNATPANGITWLPWNPAAPTGVVILRNMLPAATFHQAVQDVPPGATAQQAQAILGPFYPVSRYCDKAQFESGGPRGCLDPAPTPTLTPTPTATPTPTRLTVAQATGLVRPSGQGGVASATQVGQQVTVSGAVQGSGWVTGSMQWTLTAQVPAGVPAGTVPVAVFATTAGPEGFPCAAVAAGAATVGCVGTTGGNALQGSVVTVVFAPGLVSVGAVRGPAPPGGAPLGTAFGPAGGAAPLVPPPIWLPPPPSPLLVPLPSAARGAAGPAEIPVIPEGDPLGLLLAGLGGLSLLARLRARPRRRP